MTALAVLAEFAAASDAAGPPDAFVGRMGPVYTGRMSRTPDCSAARVIIVTLVCAVSGSAPLLPIASAAPVRLDPPAVADILARAPIARPEWQLPSGRMAKLELARFDVTVPHTRFVVAGHTASTELAAPRVTLYRGRIVGDPHSRVYLGVTSNGQLAGRIQSTADSSLRVSTQPTADGAATTVIESADGAVDAMPDVPELCGLNEIPTTPISGGGDAPEGAAPTERGPRVAEVAIDADQSFVNLFTSTDAAAEYIVMLIGAVSDIYIRDIDVKLVISFVRLWPDGGEPFSADDISGFRSYWLNNEDPSPYNLVHLLSGRRDTPYGGVAYLGGTCSGQATYGISALLHGSFPTPVTSASLGNWDVIVVAHEMGHNLGTYHTHDGYDPPIDNCGNGTPTRGTIMSYCHTHPGGITNIDLHMHRRVEQVIRQEVADGNCFWYDCNGNGIDDLGDISGGASLDLNADGVPDECEDCDADGTLDSVELASGAADLNANGIPDSCESDCDGNDVPDAFETVAGTAADNDGNNSPDSCDPDCDSDGLPDFDEFVADLSLDLDRDRVLDSCQDCDGNGVTDWLDLERQRNLYVASRDGYVREYHRRSGVPIQNLSEPAGVNAYDVTFGADRQLYVADNAGDRIVRINVDSGASSVFVPAGSGGLNGPSGLVFGADGQFYVSSRLTSSVIRYNGLTGALIGTFVAAGTGGLTQPLALTFGPNGNLFVTSADHRVLEFAGTDGGLVGTFVSAGSAGLQDPRGLAFKPDGHLLVTSFDSDQVLEYAADGSPLGQYNDEFPLGGPWGIRLGPNGNVFVTRTGGAIRIVEFDLTTGRYLRAFIRNDPGLSEPTTFAWRPGSNADCNGNDRLDTCDLASGASLDCNANARPDECDVIVLGDFNADGVSSLADLPALTAHLTGPEMPIDAPVECAAAYLAAFDFDGDTHLSLRDFAGFQVQFSGP